MYDTLKILLVSLLCIILIIQPLNNLLIVLNYMVNKDFVATVLCINRDIPENDCEGRCQVTEQFKEQEDKKKEQSGIMSNKSDVTLYLPMSFANQYPPVNEENYHVTYKNKKPTTPPSSIFHPPRQYTAYYDAYVSNLFSVS